MDKEKLKEINKKNAEYRKQFSKMNYKKILFACNRKKDDDIIEKLDTIENVNSYIKKLIRNDIGK